MTDLPSNLVTRLRMALYRYGEHLSGCPKRPCHCGLLDEWRAAELPETVGDVMRVAQLPELKALSDETPCDVLALVQKERDSMAEVIARGKGTWPQQDYVRDETWASWQGQLSVLESILRRAAPKTPVAHERAERIDAEEFPEGPL